MADELAKKWGTILDDLLDKQIFSKEVVSKFLEAEQEFISIREEDDQDFYHFYKSYLDCWFVNQDLERVTLLSSINFTSIKPLEIIMKMFMSSMTTRIITKTEFIDEIVKYLVSCLTNINCKINMYGFPKFLLRNNYLDDAIELFDCGLSQYPLVDNKGLTMDEFINNCDDDTKAWIMEEMNRAFLNR